MTSTQTVALCRCGHAERMHERDVAAEHDRGACMQRACGCSELAYDGPAPRPPAAEPTVRPEKRLCSGCRETKPVTEFYLRRNDGTTRERYTRCRDCENTRPRQRPLSKYIRQRARHRATAELQRRHADEFRLLLDAETVAAQAEADRLAQAADDRDRETIRLRPGPRRTGQDTRDRIDVARCPDCVRHHDAGHICSNCGAAPADHHTQPEGATA